MKKAVIVLLFLVLVIPYPVHNFLELTKTAQSKQAETKKGINIVENYYDYDVQKIENRINSVQKRRSLIYGGTQREIDAVLSSVDKGETTLRRVFGNVYFVGDSLMNGLEVYNILNGNNLITQVSASLYHLADNLNKIIGLNPPVLIIHYGINMIGTTAEDRAGFIKTYSELIGTLRKELPGTRLIVSGIFPVDTTVATNPAFKNIGHYNKDLKKMCVSLGVEYLDSTQILKAHPECYGGDGIHLSQAFYEKYWLRFIIEEKGIVG